MMTATRPTVPFVDHPPLNAAELRWAVDEVSALMQQADTGSVVGMVLKQTLRELASLKQSAESTVIGPFRMKAA